MSEILVVYKLYLKQYSINILPVNDNIIRPSSIDLPEFQKGLNKSDPKGVHDFLSLFLLFDNREIPKNSQKLYK